MKPRRKCARSHRWDGVESWEGISYMAESDYRPFLVCDGKRPDSPPAEAFYAMHAETMRRIDAAMRRRFAAAFYDIWTDMHGTDVSTCNLRIDGKIVSHTVVSADDVGVLEAAMERVLGSREPVESDQEEEVSQ